MKRITFIACWLSVFILPLSGQDNGGWRYLGLKRPGRYPTVFAPGIVSTKLHEHSSPTFSADLKEIYWSVFTCLEPGALKQEIYRIVYKDGAWTGPEPAPFSGKHSDGGPCFSPDGKKLFFYSERPRPGAGAVKDDLYYMIKTGSGFSPPVALGFSQLASREKWIYAPSVTEDGVLYMTGSRGSSENSAVGIYTAPPRGDRYGKPVLAGNQINSGSRLNWTSFIAPDESYLIFSSNRAGNHGFNDLYISFNKNGKWSTPLNMGTGINNGSQVRFPSVSPDGKYLFFTRENGSNMDDIFWMDAAIISELQKKAFE